MEPAPTACKKPAPALPLPLPLPPALLLVRARSRASRVVADLDAPAAATRPPAPPDTPPRRSPVTVPFLWEEAPGKPKAAAPGPALTTKQGGGGGQEDKAHAEEARPAPPLRLPPRLQHVAPSPADAPASPTAVLQGPYYGCAGGGGKRAPPPPRSAAFRRTPSAGAALFSRARSKLAAAAAPGGGKNRGHGLEPDATPWGSPAASSASSSSSAASSVSASCFGDDHGHRRRGEGHDEECSEEDDSAAAAGGYVRITRFRTNRSLPTIVTTSHLWASLRRSVKQITPWS